MNLANKTHPVKFTMWVAIASIVMMFAGLTSAYLVKRGQAGWLEVETPRAFLWSTLAILASSVAIQLARRAFREREMVRYRTLLAVTLGLGLLFIVLQWIGFSWMWEHGVRFEGASAGQFIYIIAGLHALHLIGGVVALAIIMGKAYFGRTKTYSSTQIDVMSTYWHFVDALWLYLLIFFIWIG